MKVVSLKDLSEIPNTQNVITAPSGATVNMSKYFDDRWENMDPVYCFALSPQLGNACVIKVNDVYAMPLFNHYGEFFDNTTVDDDAADSGPYLCDW